MTEANSTTIKDTVQAVKEKDWPQASGKRATSSRYSGVQAHV